MLQSGYSWHRGGLLVAILVLTGCVEELVIETQLKTIDEVVTEEELAKVERIIRQVSDSWSANLPICLLGPPEWSPNRTLPLAELLVEEQQRLDQAWESARWDRFLKKHPSLPKILRKEAISSERFASLLLALAAARLKRELPAAYPVDEALRKGEKSLETLRKIPLPFSALPLEVKYQRMQQATWLARMDRLRRLQSIPDSNVELVRNAAEWLDPVIPSEFRSHPMTGLTDWLAEFGVPFEELASGPSDKELQIPASEMISAWPPQTAFRGSNSAERASSPVSVAPMSLPVK